jgi:hypothetical protein
VDYRALVVLIVKTAGLVLVLYAIALLPDRLGSYLLSAESFRSNALFVGMVIVPFIVPMAIGAFMLWLPATGARAVVGAPFASGTELERLVQPLIFSGIGLFLALDGVRALAYYAAFNAYTREVYAGGTVDDPSARADIVSNVVSLVIGVALVLGARGLSAALHRLRYGS